jgi:hypothetical protein
VDLFRSIYGTSACNLAEIWEDLRTNPAPSIKLDETCRPIYLLLTYRWLKCYESEKELYSNYGISVNTISKWTAIMVKKVAALRILKVRYDDIHSLLALFIPHISHLLQSNRSIPIGKMMMVCSWRTQSMAFTTRKRRNGLSVHPCRRTN